MNDISLQFAEGFAGSGAQAAETERLHRQALTPARTRRWADRALAQPALIAVRVVGAREGRQLNRAYRGRDYATNVLTFAYPPLAPGQALSADIVLCAPVVAREAREQRKPLLDHYAHMVVHGTLHAQGYDHELGLQQADEMEALEVLILASFGVPNPYR